jgi:hypothetical protein
MPDRGAALTATLAAAEALLISLASAEEDGLTAAPLPGPLAGGVAREAVGRLWDAVAPTQYHGASGPPSLHVPDIRVVDLDLADVNALGAAVACLRHRADVFPASAVAAVLDGHVALESCGDSGARLAFLTEIEGAHQLLHRACADGLRSPATEAPRP